MCIVRVEQNDIPKLQSIAERCLTEFIQLDEQIREELLAHTASNIEDYVDADGSDFFKYVERGRVLGYILVKDHWNLSDLFIIPTDQGRGIGTKLLKFAISSAETNSEKGYIWVNSSENAEEFYRKHGFTTRTVKGKNKLGSVPLELVL